MSWKQRSADIHAAYKAGTLTARQLVQTYLDRIDAYDKKGPAINSIISLNPKALEEADRLDAAFKASGFVGPLHGIPVIMKDQADIAGLPTTLGSVLFKDYMPDRDCFVVAKLKKAGVIFIGKATLGELGGGDTHGSLFGSTRNVYDLERTAGGSSGGSGASVSANFCAVAVGQEGFASIRRPSIWNGVVGMRPTMGLVSRGGVYGGWPTINGTLGPMARTVTDAAKLLDSMVGYDPDDPVTGYGVGNTADSYSATLDKAALKGARIGILRETIGYAAEPDNDDFKQISEVFDKAVSDLRQAGAEIVDPIVIPDLKALIAKRARSVEDDDLMFELFFKGGKAPFATRADAMASPLFQKVTNSARKRWTNAIPGAAARLSQGARHPDDQPVEGHGRSPAGRHRPQGGRASADADQGRRQSALRRPEGRAAHQHLPDVRALDRGAGRIYPGQPTGRDHISRTALRRRQDDPARLRLRAGEPASARAGHHAVAQM